MESKYTWNIHFKIYFGSILPYGDSTLLTLDFEKLQEATLQVYKTSLLKMGYENVTFPSCFAILQYFCKKTILLFWNFLKILGVIILDRIKSVLFRRNFYLCLLRILLQKYIFQNNVTFPSLFALYSLVREKICSIFGMLFIYYIPLYAFNFDQDYFWMLRFTDRFSSF